MAGTTFRFSFSVCWYVPSTIAVFQSQMVLLESDTRIFPSRENDIAEMVLRFDRLCLNSIQVEPNQPPKASISSLTQNPI